MKYENPGDPRWITLAKDPEINWKTRAAISDMIAAARVHACTQNSSTLASLQDAICRVKRFLG